MRNSLKMAATLLTVSFLATTTAYAEVYFGISGVATDYDDSSSFDTDDLIQGFSLTLGYDFNPYVSTEIRWYEYVDSSENKDNGITYEIDARDAYGAYLKAGYPFGSGAGVVKLYGIAGFSYVDYKISQRGENQITSTFSLPYEISDNDTESGISYGLGADFYFTEKASINLEYLRALDKSDFEADNFSIGIFLRF